MKDSAFSVVHNGPIKYTGKLWKALQYARNCANRKGFLLDGKWHHLKSGDKLTVYRLKAEVNYEDTVQTFTVQ